MLFTYRVWVSFFSLRGFDHLNIKQINIHKTQNKSARV